MPQNIQQERLRWVLMVEKEGIRLIDVLHIFPYSERTLKRWLSEYRRNGKNGLIPKSTTPKRCRNSTDEKTKKRILELRKKNNLCALKLKWKLKKEGILIHERTIGKILKKENLVRRYRVKKIQYKYIKSEKSPGDLVEIDVKYVPGKVSGKRYYQYTAIDCASRWRYLKIYDEQCNYNSVKFLEEVIKVFPYKIKAVKTDNGAIFTNRYSGGNLKRIDLSHKRVHSLDMFCIKNKIIHYLIDPGKPAQNGTVERSHREDQEKFYEKHSFKSYVELQKKIRVWNEYYNNLEHCGLNGKTPNEMLR